MPETTSSDKQSVLRAFGAEVVLARADVAADDPGGYIGRARALAAELGAFLPDQFENPANPGSHFGVDGARDAARLRRRARRLRRVRRQRRHSGRNGAVPPRKNPRLARHRRRARSRRSCAGDHGGTVVEGVLDDLERLLAARRDPGRSRGGSRPRGASP